MLKNKRNNYKTKDITSVIYEEIGLSKKFSESFVKNVFNIITNSLKKNNTLKFPNFGSFKVLDKPKRMGRNPKNKKNYEISSRKTVVFRTAKHLSKKLNG